jgi:hypothetical protein
VLIILIVPLFILYFCIGDVLTSRYFLDFKIHIKDIIAKTPTTDSASKTFLEIKTAVKSRRVCSRIAKNKKEIFLFLTA